MITNCSSWGGGGRDTPPYRCGYRGELDVDGVIEGQLALQILELFHVLAAGGLPNVIYVEHAGIPAVRHDHSPQIWKSDRGSGVGFGFEQGMVVLSSQWILRATG